MKRWIMLILSLAFATGAFATTVRDKMTYSGPVTFSGTVTQSGTVTTSGAVTQSADITLDDGVTASPSLIFKDATDETATLSKTDAGFLGITTVAGDGLNVLTGNLKVGNGTPGVSQNGEDAYIEGTLEVDSLATLDAGATVAGGVVNLNASSNNAVNIGTGTTTSTVTIGGSAAQTIAIGDGAAAKTVTLGSTNTTSTTNINAGSGGVIVTGTMAATSPKITTSILDADGDPMFGFTASAGTAVNYWRFDNAATGVIPAIYMIGDTNVSLSLNLKGSGAFRVQNQTATDDTIAIAPATGGGATYTGTITSADLTAAKTWTLPDATGTIATTAGVGSYKTVTAGSGTNNLTTADCGKVYTAAADADAVFNLPAVAAGCAYTFFNIGAAGNNLLTVNPDNADAIFGTVTLAASVVVINGAAGDAISNTKGTSQKGDTVTLVGTSAGWMIQASTGIWADIN